MFNKRIVISLIGTLIGLSVFVYAQKVTPTTPGVKDAASAKQEQPKLNAHGDARFIDNGDQTITDSRTGLMWTKHDSGVFLSWRGAKQYCAELKLGGHTDWRLPTVAELRGLYDTSCEWTAKCSKTATVHINPIFALWGQRMWSSEKVTADRGFDGACNFDFGTGNTGTNYVGDSWVDFALAVRVQKR